MRPYNYTDNYQLFLGILFAFMPTATIEGICL